MQQNTFRTAILTTLLSAALISAGCANDSKSDSPPPAGNNKPQSEQKSPESKPADQTYNTQKADQKGDKTTNVTYEDQQLAKTPPPTSTTRNAAEVSKVVEPRDETTTLFTLMLTSTHGPQIDNARDRLVNEVFSDEGAAPVKIALIQASVAKLANNGLYTDEPRARVHRLQSKLNERYESEQYSDVLTKGAIFAATSFLVLGPVAAGGVYRHVPEIGTKIKNGAKATRTAWRENVADKVGDKWRNLKSNVTDPERRRHVFSRGRHMADDVAQTASRPFRSAEQLLRENLEDIGVSTMDHAAINELRVVEGIEMPESVIFTETPKPTMKFAIVDHWAGEDLGMNRRIVFRQDRLMRGSPLETTLVTNPMPEEVAAGLGSRLTRQAIEPPERDFVNVVHPETGAVASTRVTWQRFREAIAEAGAKYRPLVLSPTSLGVGATTTAAALGGYWWGYEDGHLYGRTANAMNLEAFTPSPGAPSMTVRVIQGSK